MNNYSGQVISETSTVVSNNSCSFRLIDGSAMLCRRASSSSMLNTPEPSHHSDAEIVQPDVQQTYLQRRCAEATICSEALLALQVRRTAQFLCMTIVPCALRSWDPLLLYL